MHRRSGTVGDGAGHAIDANNARAWPRLGSPSPYALKLAEKPENFSEVLQGMLNERNKDTDEWLTLVARIVEAHRDAGILDLVVESDTVLRKTLEMMGIELPPVDRDAPLVPDFGGK